MSAWLDNPGTQPPRTRGKRIRVQFPDGRIAQENKPPCQPGWDANSTRWRKYPASDPRHQFDVAKYQVIE